MNQLVPPNNIEAEQALLGSVMLRSTAMNDIAGIVTPEIFYSEKHRIIWKVMFELFSKSIPIDLISVSSKLQETNSVERIGGVSYLAELASGVLTSTNAKHYAEIVKGKYLLRNLISTSEYLRDVGFENASEKLTLENAAEFLGRFQKRLMDIFHDKNKEISDMHPLIEEYSKVQEMYLEKARNGQQLIGFSTGYTKLDQIIDGFRPEHLIIIGGYTSMGKTFSALNFVRNVMAQKKRFVFYSLEMSKTDVISRLLGIMTGYGGTSILKGNVINKQFVAQAKKELADSGSAIYSELNGLNEILLSMTEESHHGVDLFVLDFLQLVNVKGVTNEYESIRTVMNAFQSIAKKLKVPIILLSQISNEAAKNSQSNVMGFKGSGSIAAAADLALELLSGEDDHDTHRKKLANGEPVKIRWAIKKNRHGRMGNLNMIFDGATGLFKEDTEDAKADEEFKNFSAETVIPETSVTETLSISESWSKK